MRGNRVGQKPVNKGQRSIPASAGEPPGQCRIGTTIAVYPRECGGTQLKQFGKQARRGLSPRVRGNHGCSPGTVLSRRSIPASAGEPFSTRVTPRAIEVYPRECGGTECHATLERHYTGLSPRVRGNRNGCSPYRCSPRSIPASAGEPYPPPAGARQPAVYPRECGGTGPWFFTRMTVKGLSPRVRGNLLHGPPQGGNDRSIPASAGEPLTMGKCWSPFRVYPRECGGTTVVDYEKMGGTGLSPRVRGNRIFIRPPTLPSGSIPASAGEPRWWTMRRWAAQVYPRECGGTVFLSVHQLSLLGLSPRVRGNPRAMTTPTAERGVYPRECGGTPYLAGVCPPHCGLSPRVRGNHWPTATSACDYGSIPASAGEP